MKDKMLFRVTTVPGPEEGRRKACRVFSEYLTLPHPSGEVVSVSKKAIFCFPFTFAVVHGATYTCQEGYLTAVSVFKCFLPKRASISLCAFYSFLA